MKKFRVIENGIKILCEVEEENIDQVIQIVKVNTGIPINLLYSDVYEFIEVIE